MLQEIQTINETKDLSTLKTVLNKILTFHDLPNFLYGMRMPQVNKTHKDFVFDHYPEHWLKRYQDKKYIEVDTILLYSAQNNVPIVWDDKLFNQVPEFREESIAAGLEFGMTVPIHGVGGEYGLFSVATDESKALNSESFMKVIALVPFIHEKIKLLQNSSDNFYPKIPELSKREIEILKWTAIGKTAFETSQILNISDRTVVFHLCNINKKLSCTTKNQSVALALTHGLIRL